MKNFLRTVIFFIFIIWLWELLSMVGFFNLVLFPPPSKLIQTFYQNMINGQILNDVWISLVRTCMGLVIGSILGITAGLLTGRLKLFKQTMGQLFDFLRAVPPVAMLPIFIVWLGIGEVSKVSIIIWGVFFPVWINTLAGVKNINLNYLRVAQIFKLKRWKKICLLFLPGSLPFIVTGIRNAIAVAYILMFVAEFVGASSGIGYRIAESHLVFRVDKMMVGLVVLGALGFVTDFLFQKIVNKSFPWLKVCG